MLGTARCRRLRRRRRARQARVSFAAGCSARRAYILRHSPVPAAQISERTARHLKVCQRRSALSGNICSAQRGSAAQGAFCSVCQHLGGETRQSQEGQSGPSLVCCRLPRSRSACQHSAPRVSVPVTGQRLVCCRQLRSACRHSVPALQAERTAQHILCRRSARSAQGLAHSACQHAGRRRRANQAQDLSAQVGDSFAAGCSDRSARDKRRNDLRMGGSPRWSV